MAAARVVLLAMSVVGFAAIWSADGPPPVRQVAQSEPAAVEAVDVERPAIRAVSLTQPVDAAVLTATNELPASWQAALPHGVTPGDYLLVSATGSTQRVTVTVELLQSLGQDPDVQPEPLYTLQASDAPAYLIRVTTAFASARIAAR